MTKKTITKKLAKRWLKAVRSLRDHYQGEDNTCKKICPLCTISIEERTSKCNYTCICPWQTFEKKSCPDDAAEKRRRRDKRWATNSIKRLNRWEKKLNKIIKE